MAHHVIYIPGLADDKFGRLQHFAVGCWLLLGVRPHYYPMHWADKKPLGGKMKPLLELIDKLAASEGDKVSLVASSAGASVALLAYKQRAEQIEAVVCIAGAINGADEVNPLTYKANPAFKQSMSDLQDVLPELSPMERYRIMSMHPLKDETVAPRNTIIRGAREWLMPVSGHSLSIALGITLYSSAVMHFVKHHGQKEFIPVQ